MIAVKLSSLLVLVRFMERAWIDGHKKRGLPQQQDLPQLHYFQGSTTKKSPTVKKFRRPQNKVYSRVVLTLLRSRKALLLALPRSKSP